MYSYTVPLNTYNLANLFTKIPCCDQEHHRDSGRGRRGCLEPKTLLLHDNGDFALVHSDSPLYTNYILIQGNGQSRMVLLRIIVNGDASVPSGHSDLEESELDRGGGDDQQHEPPDSSGDGSPAAENKGKGERMSPGSSAPPAAGKRASQGEDLGEWQVV